MRLKSPPSLNGESPQKRQARLHAKSEPNIGMLPLSIDDVDDIALIIASVWRDANDLLFIEARAVGDAGFDQCAFAPPISP
jgi:hypothetical protein